MKTTKHGEWKLTKALRHNNGSVFIYKILHNYTASSTQL